MKSSICLNCDNVFYIKKFDKNRPYKTCSLVCRGQHRFKTQTMPNVLAGGISESWTKKKVLIEIYGENCSRCGVGAVWNNMPLSLQVDHIDGDSDNNLFENLRLLCPNCHTQTDTYGRKGKGSRYKKLTKRNKYLREYKSMPH